MIEFRCKDCGAWTRNYNHCDACIAEDDRLIAAWEDKYVKQCDDELDDAAYERQQKRNEQRYLENDANWQAGRAP